LTHRLLNTFCGNQQTSSVAQEMNLLGEADQPGNQLDDYITRLSGILAQKAAVVVDLQDRLEQFQRHLNENNVLLYA
jgi:kinesin family member 2/24